MLNVKTAYANNNKENKDVWVVARTLRLVPLHRGLDRETVFLMALVVAAGGATHPPTLDVVLCVGRFVVVCCCVNIRVCVDSRRLAVRRA
jgi:hypothetical protein